MKSVICFTESLGGGGAEHQMVILAGFLAEKGYDVAIATYADVPDHYDIPIGVKRIRIGENKKSFLKLLSVFSFFVTAKVKCVISYRKMCNIRLLIPMFFRSRRIKVICSERNTTMGKPDLSRRFMVHILYYRADYIVPNSDSQTNYMKNENPRLIHKLRTIHNFTDLIHFKESKMPVVAGVFRIAVFARYSKQKNAILFAEALKELKERTDCYFEVHWYGDQKGTIQGYNADFLKVKSKVEELGIQDVFILHPAVKDPLTLMDGFHAICLPSLYEGFSNSVAEAICCGKPMLVSDVADNGVMVHDGVNGFLFDPKRTISISNAFLKFFNLTNDEMFHMSQNSRKRAEELFNKEKFVEQYMELIEA